MEINGVNNAIQQPSLEPLSPASRENRPSARSEPGGNAPARPQSSGADKVTISPEAAEKSREEEQVREMRSTEEKVKAHEAAHKAAGGELAGSVSYQYRTGPDGRSYITGGEVQIDMSPGRTPQETISKMERIIRAALSPSDPSAQDRAVAAQAAATMAEAQQELLKGDEEKPSPIDAAAGKEEPEAASSPSPITPISTYA